MGNYTKLFFSVIIACVFIVAFLVLSKDKDERMDATNLDSKDVMRTDTTVKVAGFAPRMSFEDIESVTPGGQFIIGIQQEPAGLHPLFGSMMAKIEVLSCLFRNMVEMNADWEYYPVLVNEIPTRENGLLEDWDFPGIKKPDGSWEEEPSQGVKVTWNFLEGLTWSDGHPLGPEDAKFTWEVIVHKDVPVVSRDYERRIAKMEIAEDDPNQLIVYWKTTFAYYYLGAISDTHYLIPKHILESEFKSNPTKMDMTEYNRHPVSNGAFRFKEWVSGNHIILERNPNYPSVLGPPALLDEIVYRIISNTNALQTTLKTGEIHAISPTGISFDEAVMFKKREGDAYSMQVVSGLVWEHIDMNMDHPPLDDVRVRKAVMHGINRQFIVDRFFDGKQQVSHTWLPPKHYGANPNVTKYEYDPEKAKTMLDEAGWKQGANGMRERDGVKLQVIIQTTADNQVRQKIEEYIQVDLKAIGVDVIIKNEPANVLFETTAQKRQYKNMIMYAWMMSPISDGESQWTIDNIPTKENLWMGQNYPGWRNEEVSEIHENVVNIMDVSERVKMLHRSQKLWSDELPCIPLYFRNEVSLTNNALKNWRLTGSQTPVSWNCFKWHFEK